MTSQPRALTSRSLDTLSPVMRPRVDVVLAAAPGAGLDLRGIDAYRDPWEQARLYLQGHNRAQVVALQAKLEALGWPKLATILDQVGDVPRGATVTNAGPGEGWHSYGAAWDACPLIGRRLAWSIPAGDPEHAAAEAAWEQYGVLVGAAGLTWGGAWGDRPHCQLHPATAHPLRTLSREEVEAWAAEHGWW